MVIDREIYHLLYECDCVIIPEFGGFVTNYRAATVDRKKNLFRPPGKDISFNRNLKRNDGLLANFLADEKDISFQEANSLIKRDVESFMTLLNSGKRVEFEKVGILYFDPNKNLLFNPTGEANFLMDSFGLRVFYAPEIADSARKLANPVIEESTKQAEESTIREDGKQDETPVIKLPEPGENEKGQQRKIYKIAAAILFPILAYSGWVSYNSGFKSPTELTIADLNPFKNAESVVYHPQKAPSQPVIRYSSPGKLPDNTILKLSLLTGEPDANGVVVSTYPSTPKSQQPVEYNYHVVAGCFADKENAQSLVSQLRNSGYKAYLVDHHRGLYRVSAAGFAHRSKALSTLSSLRSQLNVQPWLLHKHVAIDPSEL